MGYYSFTYSFIQLCEVLTCLYIEYSNTQLLCFVDLRTKSPTGRSLGLGHEGNKGLGVNKFLTPGEFEFPVLLDKRDGKDGLVDERGAVDGRYYVRCLRRGYGLPSETTWQLCVEGRTCRMTFPGISITSWTVT